MSFLSEIILINPLHKKVLIICMLIVLAGCQSKELSPFEKAKNPYAQLGVEGYMGAAMTSCLGMAPPGPPIIRRKDGNSVVSSDRSPEQDSYFHCIDREVLNVEHKQADSDLD